MSEQVSEQVIANIRERVAKCRRLAAMINDQQATTVLLEMAAEGEADIRRLEADQRDA